MSQWKQLPKNLPSNGQTVWIRTIYLVDYPFLATYNTTNQNFTDTQNSIVYPAYTVYKWKIQ